MSGIIGAATSFIGSLISNHQSGKNVTKQLKFQREENALNRQFNSDEAQKARDFQQHLINQYREYSSPAAQMARFEEAGLNPSLAYGNLSDTNTITSGQSQASYSGGVSPVQYSPLDLSVASNQLALSELNAAKAKEAKSNAGLADQKALTESLMRDGQLTYQGIQIALGNSQLNLNEKQAGVLSQEAMQMSQAIEESKQRISLMEKQGENITMDTAIKRLNYQFESKSFQDRLDMLASQAHCSVAAAKFAVAQAFAHLYATEAMGKNFAAQAFMNSSLGKYYTQMETNQKFIGDNILPSQWNSIKWSNQGAAFNLEQARKYSDAHNILQIGGGVVHMFTDIAGAVFMPVKGFGH